MDQKSEQKSQRFRVALSDGKRTQNAMLATQLNCMLVDGSISLFTVITLEEYIVNQVKNEKIVIILKCRVEGNPGRLLGQPMDDTGAPRVAEGLQSQQGGPPQQQANQQQWGAPKQPQQGAGNTWGAPSSGGPPPPQQANQWGQQGQPGGPPPQQANQQQWGAPPPPPTRA